MAYQIQILGLRERWDEKKKKFVIYEAFHNKMWRADNEDTIFQDPNSILAKIPDVDRWNIYWTVARCFPDRGRKLAEQYMVCWDIDHIGAESQEDGEAKAKLVAQLVCQALGIEYSETGVIFSGHGVQLFIKLINPILSEDYFDAIRDHYKVLADRVQAKLKFENVSGIVDTSVFSAGRLMRMPNTINRKKDKPERYARVLQAKLVPVNFDIMEKSGVAELKKPSQIHPDTIKKYPPPDTKAVLDGCLFIQNCFANQSEIREPQWYAAISIVGLLQDGQKLVHEMSEKHPGYNEHETDEKLRQATENSGPRTCKDIATRWDGCIKCPHYGTDLTSPILIRGPDYIKSETFGFREVVTDKEGNVKPGKPVYGDLVKKFSKENPFVTIAEQRAIYQFNGMFWEEVLDLFIKNWMNGLVVPAPSATEMTEFLERLKAHNVRGQIWFTQTAERKMNFKNGVLDLETMEVTPHSPEHGFTFVLNYNYDPRAECATWDKFMLDITENRPDLVSLLEEYGGYAIAGGDCLAQKALVLYGQGSNGKSVFAETIEQVLGAENTGHLMIHHLKQDQMRSQLLHKPYNYSDETLEHAFKNPGEFKSLVTGGMTTAKVVYKATFSFKNKAKFVILTNRLPDTNDSSDGLHRRLLIVQLTSQFKGAADNKMLRTILREKELAGICNRFIEGYKRLIARQYNFDIPESVQALSESYMRDSNAVLRFFEECCEKTTDPYATVSSQELYGEYRSWMDFQNEKPHTMRNFSKEFRIAAKLGNAIDIKEEGKVFKGWRNLKLNKGTF